MDSWDQHTRTEVRTRQQAPEGLSERKVTERGLKGGWWLEKASPPSSHNMIKRVSTGSDTVQVLGTDFSLKLGHTWMPCWSWAGGTRKEVNHLSEPQSPMLPVPMACTKLMTWTCSSHHHFLDWNMKYPFPFLILWPLGCHRYRSTRVACPQTCIHDTHSCTKSTLLQPYLLRLWNLSCLSTDKGKPNIWNSSCDSSTSTMSLLCFCASEPVLYTTVETALGNAG